jgi:DNA polymerase zeta
LHKRIALYSFKDLTTWWNNPLFRHRTLSHYLFRVRGVLQILEQLDLVGRTSELARLFGIQFYEVLSRGSQFRVESMMLRLAKPLNYIPVSPSVQQRAKMKAPEFLPLILEPESKLYVDPVIVLDFQSLYPSMIIAYNYCFSTCIGRATHLGRNAPFEFGATQLRVSRARVKKLLNNDSLNFSPCGVAYVKSSVRDGILPKMLREILDTRLMVKNSMKKNKEDGVLQKVLHNRQLGLKLIANVTYGYTAANFSGRMPAVELADSVVSKGRETLQRAIEMVENTPEWKAKVVYGDTDSLFVLVPGRSRDEAFEIGKKIADAVTEDNPDPVKLKLEKVYHPCILQTKKRYVGYMYESPDQSEPVYLAKGIETVRRDGCPAVAKVPLTLF